MNVSLSICTHRQFCIPWKILKIVSMVNPEDCTMFNNENLCFGFTYLPVWSYINKVFSCVVIFREKVSREYESWGKWRYKRSILPFTLTHSPHFHHAHSLPPFLLLFSLFLTIALAPICRAEYEIERMIWETGEVVAIVERAIVGWEWGEREGERENGKIRVG